MVGIVVVIIMFQWRVFVFIESNIVVFENFWEGLWMSCMRYVNIRMQCKVYDFLLVFFSDLQVFRGFMCIVCVLVFLVFMTVIFGMKCIRCIGDDEKVKGYILFTVGIIFIIIGMMVFIFVSWVVNFIIRDFYNFIVEVVQKREFGEVFYIGWITALMLIVGGVFFCCVFCCIEKSSSYRYFVFFYRII